MTTQPESNIASDLKNLTEQAALGNVLTSWGDLSFDDVMRHLTSGVLRDDIVFWEPFEHEEPEKVAELIKNELKNARRLITDAFAIIGCGHIQL